MLIIKPKYKKKKGGSLKSLVTNPYLRAVVEGVVSGAAKTYLGKRKHDNFINTSKKIRKLGKGIVYE